MNLSSCLLSSPPCYNLPGHQLASAQEKLFNQNFFDVFIKGWKGGGERFYDLVHFTRVASPKDQKYFLAFRDLVLTLINLVKRFFWTQISSISISSSTFSIIMSLCFFVLFCCCTELPTIAIAGKHQNSFKKTGIKCDTKSQKRSNTRSRHFFRLQRRRRRVVNNQDVFVVVDFDAGWKNPPLQSCSCRRE